MKIFRHCLHAIAPVLLLSVTIPIILLLPQYTSAQTPSSLEQRVEAWRLLEQGFEQLNAGQFSAALDYFQRALPIFQTTGDRRGEAYAHVSSGRAYSSVSQYRSALSAYQTALPILIEVGDRAGVASTLSNVGGVYQALGDYPKALDYYQQALAISIEIGDRRLEGVILSNMGVVYNALSNYPQALDYYQQALAINRELGNSPEEQLQQRRREGTILNNLGEVYLSLGNYPQALDYYQQALAIAIEVRNRDGEGTTLAGIGEVYRATGNYHQALDSYQQALTIHRALGSRREMSTILNSIGSAYLSLDNYPQALSHYQQALAISRDIGDRALESTTLSGIGLVHLQLGDYDQSLNYYQQALTISRDIGDRRGEGVILNNIGGAYRNLENYPQALDYYQQALAVSLEVGNRDGEGRTLNNLGFIYSYLGDYPQALNYYQRALAIRTEIGDRTGQSTSLNNIGAIHRYLEDYSQSLNYYQQALALSREVGDRAGEALTLNNIGFVLETIEEPELAIVFLKQSVNRWEAIRSDNRSLTPEQQQTFTERVSSSYRRLADLLLQTNRVLEAQEVLDLLKLQELDDYLNTVPGNEQTAEGVYVWEFEQQILDRYNTFLQQDSDFNTFVNQRDVTIQVAALQRIAREQRIPSNLLAKLQDNLQQLERPAVLLYPLILEDRLELVLITPNGPPVQHTVAVTQAELEQAIANFRTELTQQVGNRNRLRTQAQQLYQWLIQPLEAELQESGTQTILYAADGQLRYIPLAALHDGEQWLAQRFAINSITAASLTNFTSQLLEPLQVLAGAFSDTQQTYAFEIGDRPFSFNGLQHAAAEVENITAEIPGTMALFNQEFSRANVEPQMGRYSIVHFATHAEFVPGLPEQSFILFGNGDRVSLRDISNWSLPKVDLMVLSACRTAVSGTLGNGEEILGFGYQMQQTGARAAIASLWYVNDGGTQVLMNAFYKALEQPGMTKAEALRQAQIALITGDFEQLGIEVSPQLAQYLDRPYYWAPFILIGNGL